MQSVSFGGHFVGEAFWESFEHFGLLWVDGPVDWSSAKQLNVVEGIDVVISENDGNDFMSLADANKWPIFALDIFHEFGILEYSLGGHVIWMLLALRCDQLKSSTCKEDSINLRQKLGQFLFWNIVWNGDRPTPCPSDEIIVHFKNISLVIEASSISWTYWLSKDANHWLRINSFIAMSLVIIAFVISLPLIMDLIERQFSFEALRRSLEFLVSRKQGHEVVLNIRSGGVWRQVVKVLDVVVEFEV